jgi:phosphatidylserine/phosphatidylglycerophosphate/cardiolipin synthase-like enzyme
MGINLSLRVSLMGDLTCQPPLNYTPVESLMCQPEPLVCEAPPPPPKPAAKPKPPQDQYKPKVEAGKSTPAYPFLNVEKQVCEAPPTDASETPIDPALFTSSLAHSKLVADLDLSLTDHNGLTQMGAGDLSGEITRGTVSVNRSLFEGALQALKGTVKRNAAENTTTTVKDVRFDPQDRSYVLKLEVEKKLWKVPVWDNFEVRFKGDAQGKLQAQLDDNWMPDARILGELEKSVRETVRNQLPAGGPQVSLQVQQQGNALTFTPELKALEVPIAAQGSVKLDHIDANKAKISLDTQGNLHVKLDGVKVKGSSSTTAPATPQAGPADQLQVQLKVGIDKDNTRQMYAQGNMQVHLDEKETAAIQLGGESLGHYLHSGTLNNQFSLYLNQAPGQPPAIQSQSALRIPDAKVGDQTVDLKTALKLRYDPAQGIQLETLQPAYEPLNLQTSANGLELYVNGSEYFPEMKRLMGAAQESIDLETYMLHNDPAGHEIAAILARKAAGLSAEGPVQRDAQAPDGVGVRFIFNSWKGSLSGGAESEEVLHKAKDKVKAEIANAPLTPAQKEQALAQLEKNLQWKFFSDGILRSDHRKVLVIDGAQATVGGKNLSDKYLSDNAYHDVTLKMAGPEVSRVHREFLENWFEFRQQPQPSPAEWGQLLKSEAELQHTLETERAKGGYRQQAQVSTLVTDDHQTEIEQGMLKLIDEAEQEIYVQQAFFADERITTHLKAAMQRGVDVHVIVAENPIIDMFGPANLLSAHTLAKAKQEGAPGDIRLHYYNNPQGGETRFIHTKALSADGKRAIVGSANMIGRSLSSPFQQVKPDGSTVQTMYNKELSLFIEDPGMVQEIDQRLFQFDMQHRARELDAAAIEAAVQQAGGEAELRKKALPVPFT